MAWMMSRYYKMTSSTGMWAGSPWLLPLDYESENSMKFRNFRKWASLNTCNDFRLGSYKQTVCLKSWYHNYVRNFYVTCTPFAHQRIWKVQFVVRYPVVEQGVVDFKITTWFNMWFSFPFKVPIWKALIACFKIY